MLRVSVLMSLAPTLVNVYQATLATDKANVTVCFQNLINVKKCYIQMSMHVTQMVAPHHFHFVRANPAGSPSSEWELILE